MSILLDALKKSEEQRQLGTTPNIHSNVDSASHSEATVHQWLPVTMMTLSAIAMAWIGWQQFREPDQIMLTPASEATEQAASAIATEGAGEPGEAVVERDSSQIAGTGEGTFERGQRTAVEILPADAATPGAASASPPEGQKSAVRKSRLNQAVAAYEPKEQPQPAANEPEPEPEQEQEQERETSRRSGMEPHLAEPINYWEMPQGVRDDLPVIKITVLVFAKKPGDRFLLVNGQRLMEKDELEGGVVLEEIRRDGAIFLYRKYRFLVKG